MTTIANDGFDLDGLSARLRAAGVTTPIGVRIIRIGPGALEGLPQVVTDVLPPGQTGPIAVLDDGVPKRRGDADVTDLVRALLAVDRDVRRVVARAGEGRIHADAGTIDDIVGRVAGAACLVTVGSGTLADIGKAVSARLGGTPHVVVQTALSVNGFADDQSVLLVDGVKRTTATRWPDALIADTAILAGAPVALNGAGVGDLAAMFTAPADWLLANLLGMADGYTEVVVAMVREHGDALLRAAPRLRARDADAIATTARVLTLSGLSMGVAGATAPASGMEHTMSHLIEMAMTRRGRESAFHGAQVGVCTTLAALLWARVRERLTRAPRLLFPPEEEMEATVRGAFASLDPSGAMGEECWRLYRRKLARWHHHRERIEAVDWGGVERAVVGLLVEPAALVPALAASGTPIRFRDLDPAVDPATARWALANCHLMRDRFTVADLAYFLGAWGPEDVGAILAQAATLGAGL